MKADDPNRGKPLTVEPVGILATFVNGLIEKVKLAYGEKLEAMMNVSEKKTQSVRKMAERLKQIRKARLDKMAMEQKRITEENLLRQKKLAEERLREQVTIEEKPQINELVSSQPKIIPSESVETQPETKPSKITDVQPETKSDKPVNIQPEKTEPVVEEKKIEDTERFKKNPPKVLVSFFSRADENYQVGYVDTGNTEVMANYIIGRLREFYGLEQVDDFKITPVHQYPIKYMDTVELATSEKRTGEKPIILDEIENLSDYNVVFIGYPIWWGDFPMIMRSFFDEYDFSGKILVPFCTHEGSGESGTFQTLKNLESGATVLDGVAVAGHVAQTGEANEKIGEWLKAVAEKILELRG
ncbi:MAG: flavodoxin [Candidatus Saccharibacteria bacterium]|nr:flavodoxin [Candidatus Saccharibacteria bacterium]